MKKPFLTLEEKVARLFVIGSDSPDLAEEIEPFYRYGLGGLLLFRHHLQPFSTAMELRESLARQNQRFNTTMPPFIGIDQEGGQIERLPHWLFPTGLLPVVFGLKRDERLCEQVNREMARRLRWLGINLNFTPTVDLNRERMNPVIGSRAYGETTSQVLPFARTIVKAHQDAGVLPVAKHFPGHGSGIADSHFSLPVFEAWSEEELEPYEVLLCEGLPGIMIAHGLYPRLAKLLGADGSVPASLSEAMITRLLREKMGFSGLVFTDDLIMGAVWNDSDPIEVALGALQAGADMLVYRRAQPEAWSAFEAIVSRVQRGKLSESLLDEKLERIFRIQASLQSASVYEYSEEALSEEACHSLSLRWAQQGMVELHHQFISPLPLSQKTEWALVAPDRSSMRHYEADRARGKGLLEWCRYYGIPPSETHFYPVEVGTSSVPELWPDQKLDVIVFVAFNSHLCSFQRDYYERLKSQHPEAKLILASCGMPTDREVLSRPWIHVQLPSFRPAAMQAFLQWLITSPGKGAA